MHKYPYGIIGNCAYAALIDTTANVGWLCWPRFDSSFVFGTLLDDEKGGRFSVQPEWDNFKSSQAYIPNTNILETTFQCEDGHFKVIDYAPRFIQFERHYKPLMLVRKIVPLKGRPRIRVVCRPVGNYGDYVPKKILGSSHIRFDGLESHLRLTTDIPLSYVEGEQAFVLSETRYLVLAWGVPLEAPLESSAERYFEQTKSYWHTWVKNTSTEYFQQEAVIRSALALKLLQFHDTGALISAPTTSLTQFEGSSRSWDFRYCWLRDSYYSVKMWNELGHFSILEDYAGFIENIALNEDRSFRPFYPVAGEKEPVERVLPLKGYRNEGPVRIGNAAYQHTQNDVYGQVILTLLPFFTDKRLLNRDNSTLINQVSHALQLIESTMHVPDNGVWEFRGIFQKHCYTFLSHWAGAHAAKKIARITRNRHQELRANRLIQEAAAQIEACYDKGRGVYTQAIGSDRLDASTLQLINLGYLNPRGEKAKLHLKVLEENLKTPDGLWYRYRHPDDFGQQTTTFLLCAFWYVEALARMHRVEEAAEVFESLLRHANHLGLMSEVVDEQGNQWGNFPQAYSHVGLVTAAFTISKKLDKPIYL